MSATKQRRPQPVPKEDSLDVDFAPIAGEAIDLVDKFHSRPTASDTATDVSIELPVGEFCDRSHRPTHIEARLSPKQGRALQRLLNGLNAKHGRGWGPRERSFADVLRWLLDQLPD